MQNNAGLMIRGNELEPLFASLQYSAYLDCFFQPFFPLMKDLVNYDRP